MLAYNPRDWFHATFSLHRSETLLKLFPLILLVAAYSWLIAYWELEYLKLSSASQIKNLPQIHGLLGFVISILIVFRTNTAYDRWWEARKLWGQLVNNSRSLAIKLQAMLGAEEKISRNFFQETIPLFADTLMHHLQSSETRFMLDEQEHPEFDSLDKEKHGPNQIAALIFKRINSLYLEKKITGDQLIVLNQEVHSFSDICGACERIKNTPIPHSYSSFIKKFIFIYVLTLPFGYVVSLGYLVIPAVAFVFYILASMELIAEEIEDPFGTENNHLPLGKIAENIHKHVDEIFV